MKWWQYILGFCAAVLVIGLLTTAIIKDKQNRIDRVEDFFSQCKMDGYKLTDCYVKWKNTH